MACSNIIVEKQASVNLTVALNAVGSSQSEQHCSAHNNVTSLCSWLQSNTATEEEMKPSTNKAATEPNLNTNTALQSSCEAGRLSTTTAQHH
jgi:hypothetical protein